MAPILTGCVDLDLRDKPKGDKLMYIPNDDTQNYPYHRLQLMVEILDTQLNEPTNQNSLKSRKLLSQIIRN